MATSGYVETNSYSGAYLRLEWTRTSYDSASGINYVHWVLKGVKNSSGYYYARNFKVTSYSFVTGSTTELYYSTSDIQLSNGTIVAEGDDYFYTNANGTCKIQFNIEGAIYSYAVNCTGYDSWDLDTVPRYPSGATISVASKTATSVTINWSVNENCSQVQYKINAGNWVDVTGSGRSGSYTITGLTPATTYTIYGDFKRADSGLWCQNKPSLSVVTYAVGKITSAPDFNDEANPTIYYTNEAGNTVTSLQACISLSGGADIAYRDIPKTGSSYTFNLTTAERNVLRNATSGTSRNVIFYVTTVAGGNTYYSTLTRTLSIVNGNPTFSNYTFEDVGTVSTQYTGDSQIFINNYNNLRVTVSTSNKATANKGATMSKYRLVCGNQSVEAAYSASSNVILNLNYITSRTITVYAIDSRGNSTRVDKTISTSNWKDYSSPRISSASIARTNGIQTDTTLTFSASFWNSSFGATSNTLTECSYKYKKTSESSYGTAVSITPTISGNNISFSGLIQGDEGADGFSLSNSYDIQITIKDTIAGTRGTATYNLLLNAGNPVMAMHKNGVAFGLPYNTTLGTPVQIDNMLPTISDSVFAYSSNQMYLTQSTAWTNMKVPFDSAETIGSALSYDVSNKRIVVNKKGYIDIFARFNCYLAGYVNGDYILNIYKNGSLYSNVDYQYMSNSEYFDSMFGILSNVAVSPGDYIEMYIATEQTGTIRTFAGSNTSLIAKFRRLRK